MAALERKQSRACAEFLIYATPGFGGKRRSITGFPLTKAASCSKHREVGRRPMPQALRLAHTLILGIAFYAVLCPIPGYANAPDIPKLTRGILYRVARTHLLKSGSKPWPSSNHDPERCNGDPGVCEVYPEVDSCAADAFQPCNMFWITRNGVKFVVQVSGHGVRQLRVDGAAYPAARR